MDIKIKTDFHTIMTRAEKEGFRLHEQKMDGMSFIHKKGMVVIISESEELDKKRWLHLSVSYRGKIPDYTELKKVKNIFIGEDRKAIQIFPPIKENINIYEFCLHLWSCLDGDDLPDFSRGIKSI